VRRTIVIPIEPIHRWLANPIGRRVVVPVKVDWPELQLTVDQVVQNAIAIAYGQPRPHEDKSIFDVEIG
jgi:hypothetical protein